MSKAAKAIAAVVVTVAAALTLNPQLISAAIAMDTSVILDAVLPKPKITSAGQETRWSANPRDGIPYAVGRCAAAGNQVFMRSAGTSNKYRNYVTIYTAAGPVQAFEGFLVNDVLTPFMADGGEGASGYYLNRMWLKTQLGAANSPYLHWTATGSKDTPANHGGMPAEWTADHKLSGYAASLWGLESDTTRYAGGVPAPKMVGRWVKVYDPRKDSTYPGGVGPHRYADPTDKAAYLAASATWEWSANPALHGLMWSLGRWTGDPNYPAMPLVKTHGLGAPLAMIDVASFVEMANVDDANGWTLGGVVKSTDDKWEVLKQFLEAGGGEPILLGNKLACMVNAPKVSLATLTKADAIGDVSVAAAVAIEDRLNTIWPSYTEETQNWTVVPFDTPVQVAAYLAPDKGVRSAEMSLPLVQNPVQMAQLARYRIEDSRELTPIVIPAKPWTMWLRPGDCFTANEPEWGLNGQKLRIMQRKRDPATMKVTFVCRTETDGKHAFALGQTATPPDTPALTGIDSSIVPLPAGDAFAIIDGQVAGPGGSLPAIVLHGEADLYDAVSIVVDYRRVLPEPAGEWKSKSFPASATTLVVDGVEAGATYQVRIRYITAKGVENPDANTDLGEIVVGGVNAGSIFNKPGQEVVDEMAATLAAALNLTNQQLAQLVRERGILDQLNLIGFVTPDGKAVALNETILKLTDGMSFAQFRQALTATFGELSASIGLILEVSAAPGDTYATGSLITDVLGRITGIKVHNNGHKGQFIVVSDEFHFVDPDDTTGATAVEMLSYVNGRWVLSGEVYIQKLIAGSVDTPGVKDHAIGDMLTSTYSTLTSGTGAYVLMPDAQALDFDYPAKLVIQADLAFIDGGGNGPSYHESGLKIVVNGDELEPREESGVTAMQTLTVTRTYSVSPGAVTVQLYARTKPDDFYKVGNLITQWNFK